MLDTTCLKCGWVMKNLEAGIKDISISSVFHFGFCWHFLAPFVDVRNPFSVSVFEDHVYWSTQEKGEVFRQDKFGHGDKTKLLTVGPWLTQVSVYQQQKYNSIASKLRTHPQHTFTRTALYSSCGIMHAGSFHLFISHPDFCIFLVISGLLR